MSFFGTGLSMFRAFAAALLLLLLSAYGAQAEAPRSIVVDRYGNPVASTFQECIYTRWEAAHEDPRCGAREEDDPQLVIKGEERSYLVFFDLNSTQPSPEAKQIVTTLREQVRGKKAMFMVTGHADRSGSDAYNMEISRERALAVREALLNMDLTLDDILVDWHGERNLLVPTGDGIKEPQNRRAEIRVIPYDVKYRNRF